MFVRLTKYLGSERCVIELAQMSPGCQKFEMTGKRVRPVRRRRAEYSAHSELRQRRLYLRCAIATLIGILVMCEAIVLPATLTFRLHWHFQDSVSMISRSFR